MADAAIISPTGESRARLPLRSNSFSQASEDSQTAEEFITSQLQLEADAREALPYQFDTCTQPLGALRQSLFSCLTCNPPPSSASEPYVAAGVCYSCSISCHGEHTLVELFGKRNFVCDCGTSRLPSTSPCTLRVNEQTGTKGGIHSQVPAVGNDYNQNFRNRFCGCGEEYDPHREKGTMFQCLGLGTVEQGGCGEDWWHPECVVGMDRHWYRKSITETTLRQEKTDVQATQNGVSAGPPHNSGEHSKPATDESSETPLHENVNGSALDNSAAGERDGQEVKEEDEPPLPPGFPNEDEFEAFLCYKCVDAFPWIKKYARTKGFLPPVFYGPRTQSISNKDQDSEHKLSETTVTQHLAPNAADGTHPMKRKAPEDENDASDDSSPAPSKRHRTSEADAKTDPTSLPDEVRPANDAPAPPSCKYAVLPPAPAGRFSLFLCDDFRDQLCRCPSCFPKLVPHPQLREEEEMYEPPISEDGDGGGASAGTGSLLDRGEAALSNMDRVRAIEGVMVYNHLKDKVKAFLAPFAERGQAVGAEDIKAYFETLRGDAEAIRAAKAHHRADSGSGGGGGASGGQDGNDDSGGRGRGFEGDGRRGQSGY